MRLSAMDYGAHEFRVLFNGSELPLCCWADSADGVAVVEEDALKERPELKQSIAPLEAERYDPIPKRTLVGRVEFQRQQQDGSWRFATLEDEREIADRNQRCE